MWVFHTVLLSQTDLLDWEPSSLAYVLTELKPRRHCYINFFSQWILSCGGRTSLKFYDPTTTVQNTVLTVMGVGKWGRKGIKNSPILHNTIWETQKAHTNIKFNKFTKTVCKLVVTLTSGCSHTSFTWQLRQGYAEKENYDHSLFNESGVVLSKNYVLPVPYADRPVQFGSSRLV